MQLFLPVGMVTKPFQIVEKKSQQQHNEKKNWELVNGSIVSMNRISFILTTTKKYDIFLPTIHLQMMCFLAV